MKKILFIDNTAHHLYGQSHLYSNFARDGYQVILCCPNDGNYFYKINDMGYPCVALGINGKGMNFFEDAKLIVGIYKIIAQIKPDLIFSFTIKPNIYTAIACKFAKVCVIPNITGLGYVFLKHGILAKFVVKLYKFAFSNLKYIFFQNSHDSEMFTKRGILNDKTKIIQLPGSGVDLKKFAFIPPHNILKRGIIFVYSGRLLWDKGLGELIVAYKQVKNKHPDTQLKFIGNFYPANPSAIAKVQVEQWQRECGIEYLGMVDNVAEVIANCDCLILPSYREGMGRAILEACSVGRAVIVSDAVGCKDAVDDKITGLVCKVRDALDLTDKMLEFIEMPREQQVLMGINGRQKMEKEFSQEIVYKKYRDICIKTSP
ncbi:MAG: glycosyltransferase family 4 protein [Burkholderiales bacterium]|nr:glycosyltransferase family 4 protein [Burkholderiales bacterium]